MTDIVLSVLLTGLEPWTRRFRYGKKELLSKAQLLILKLGFKSIFLSFWACKTKTERTVARQYLYRQDVQLIVMQQD